MAPAYQKNPILTRQNPAAHATIQVTMGHLFLFSGIKERLAESEDASLCSFAEDGITPKASVT